MSKSSVLVVEDDLFYVKVLKDQLEALKEYEVCSVADNGEDAVRLAGELKPVVVLMDIVLKGKMDGIDAAGQIYSLYNIPVIYLTSDNMDIEKLARVKVSESFGYIRKPAQARELQIIIEMALYKRKMDEERKQMVAELLKALESIREMRALIPLCVSCDKFSALTKQPE